MRIILVYDDIGEFDQKSSGMVDSTAEFESPETVSYTHLTLPTILLV